MPTPPAFDIPGARIYHVGGAVRDKLLGRPVQDNDWVVVGATPAQMQAHGFLPVGKDFPVFLHPVTKEEYALARTERKTTPGYTGFAVHFDSSVTLEQDLARRDLTINAIATKPLPHQANGPHPAGSQQTDSSAQPDLSRLVDPFGGVADLRAKVHQKVLLL